MPAPLPACSRRRDHLGPCSVLTEEAGAERCANPCCYFSWSWQELGVLSVAPMKLLLILFGIQRGPCLLILGKHRVSKPGAARGPRPVADLWEGPGTCCVLSVPFPEWKGEDTVITQSHQCLAVSHARGGGSQRISTGRDEADAVRHAKRGPRQRWNTEWQAGSP